MIRVAMTSELSWQRNDAITYFTCGSISRHWELFFQNRLLELFPTIVASMLILLCVLVVQFERKPTFSENFERKN